MIESRGPRLFVSCPNEDCERTLQTRELRSLVPAAAFKELVADMAEHENRHDSSDSIKEMLATGLEIKRCPDCRQPTEKNEGCPTMECLRCGHKSLWERWLVLDLQEQAKQDETLAQEYPGIDVRKCQQFLDRYREPHFRRVRQLAEPERAERGIRRFCGGGIEKEKQAVRRTFFDRWQRLASGFELTAAVELLWSGTLALAPLLATTTDPNSRFLIEQLFGADDNEERGGRGRGGGRGREGGRGGWCDPIF